MTSASRSRSATLYAGGFLLAAGAVTCFVGMSRVAVGQTAPPAQGVALKPSVAETAPDKPAATKAGAEKSMPTKAAARDVPAGSATDKTQPRKSGQSIVVLVGDDPITGYEIEQRQRLLSQSSGSGSEVKERFQALIRSDAVKQKMEAMQKEIIQNNPGKSRDQLVAMIKGRIQSYAKVLQQQAISSVRSSQAPGTRQKALEQLIDERLMVQEAKRVGVLASDEDVQRSLDDRAKRASMSREQYAAQFKELGVDMDTMRSTFRAQMSWLDVIRRRFGSQIQVTEREVERVVSARPKDQEDDVELQLQRITLPLADKLDQKVMAKRFQEAETIWRKFDGCKSLPSLASGVAGAKLENLGPQRPSTVSEPTRGLLVSAADGSMLPPSVGSGGMELWVVCGRSVVKANDSAREAAENELRREQFSLIANRHLKDLRKDTPIEYR
ncbi:MAG: SurA N-terminal domain-containing protein [Hyphomicrobium sp.]